MTFFVEICEMIIFIQKWKMFAEREKKEKKGKKIRFYLFVSISDYLNVLNWITKSFVNCFRFHFRFHCICIYIFCVS